MELLLLCNPDVKVIGGHVGGSEGVREGAAPTSSAMMREGRRPPAPSSGGMREPLLLGGPEPVAMDPRRSGDFSLITSILGASCRRDHTVESLRDK